MSGMKVITTIPPYAPFLKEVAGYSIISGARLNTIMTVKEELKDAWERLEGIFGKGNVWADLKCRQLRVAPHSKFFNKPEPPPEPRIIEVSGEKVLLDGSNPRAVGEISSPPWSDIRISHKIKLDVSKGPVKCYFLDGVDSAHIVEVIDGNRLIMLEGPKRLVGQGDSINILDPSLEIEGFFTETDLEYITAVDNLMLSYVEKSSDIEEALALNPKAKICAKIESKKGLNWVKNEYHKYADKVQLMAARGDLFVEVGRPDKIIKALRLIINSDPNAIVASRILSSLRQSSKVSCSDIMDIVGLLEMGYRNFMIGDEICFDQQRLLLALDTLSAIAKNYGVE